MNILYIKRAYNTRVHTQVQALTEKGHSLVLLLESPMEIGYSGPGQWDVREINSRLSIIYISPEMTGSRIPQRPSLFGRVLNRIGEIEKRPYFGGFGYLRGRQFLKTLHRVLSEYPVNLILSGNDALMEEDQRTLFLLDHFEGKIPIVFDCQDMLSDCFMGNKRVEDVERAIHQRADGVIHTNPVALKWAASRYPLKRGFFFPNYSNSKYFPGNAARLSDGDGRIHLVYCGGVQQTPRGYGHPFARDMKRRFREIASLGHPLHLHLGLYPGSPIHAYYMELEQIKNIRIHPYLAFSEMMQTLSHYDVGLFPLDLSSLSDQIEANGLRVLDQCRFSRIDTSKQYEYTLAGLSVLTAPVRWISEWLDENHFGKSFHTIGDLGEILEGNELRSYLDCVRQNATRFSIERHIGGLEEFLLEISGKSRRG